MRIKKMPQEQFSEVLKRNWVPVQLLAGAVPVWLQSIPSGILHSVYASGGPYALGVYSGNSIPSGELIGGIDVYRNAPDDPMDLNKDWYAVVRVDDADSMFLVAGPLKDTEHWLNEIPSRLHNVEILSVPPKPPNTGQL